MESQDEFQDVDITFVIPVRHQNNAKDWNLLKANLANTMQSISAQETKNWRAILVANEGADLPPMPPRFSTERVTFSPNLLQNRGDAELGAFFDAARLDRGRRIRAGMLKAKNSRYFMAVDEDDFISRHVAGFVSDNVGQTGWYVKDGYLWHKGDALTFLYRDFSNLCGTSHIIRADLYALSSSIEMYSEENIKFMLGSHVLISGYLAKQGFPLAPLPFPGAVYQIGHSGSHSQSAGLLRTAFFNRRRLKAPISTLKSITQLRRVRGALQKEFNLPIS